MPTRSDLEKMSEEEINNLYARKKFLEQLPEEEINKLYAQKITGQMKAEESRPVNLEALGQGFGEAVTLGYSPHIQAAVEPAFTKAMDIFTGQNVSEDLPGYVERRDQNIAKIEQLRKQAGPEMLVGNLAGSLATAPLLGAVGPAAEGANAITRIGQAAKTGALIGALQNPGDKTGAIDPLQVSGRISGAALGGVSGAAMQGIGEGVSSGLKWLKDASAKLKEAGANRAVKATGVMLKDIRKVAKDSGLKDPEKAITQLGDFLHEKELVKPGMTFDDIVDSTKNLEVDAGNRISNVLKTVKEAAGVDAPVISRQYLANSIKNEMKVHEDIPGAKPIQETFDKLLTDLTMRPDKTGELKQLGDMTIDQVIGLRTALGKREGGVINWSKPISMETDPTQLFYRKLYNKIGDAIEDTTEKFVGDVDSTILPAYRQAKKDYAVSKTINQIAFDQQLRQLANRVISPSDYGVGLAGAGIGFAAADGSVEDKLKAAALGATAGGLHKIGRKYGSPIASDVLYKMAGSAATQGLEKGAKALLDSGIKLTPKQLGAFQQLLQQKQTNLGSVEKDKEKERQKMKRFLQENGKLKKDYSKTEPDTSYISPDEAAARFAGHTA